MRSKHSVEQLPLSAVRCSPYIDQLQSEKENGSVWKSVFFLLESREKEKKCHWNPEFPRRLRIRFLECRKNSKLSFVLIPWFLCWIFAAPSLDGPHCCCAPVYRHWLLQATFHISLLNWDLLKVFVLGIIGEKRRCRHTSVMSRLWSKDPLC